MTGVQTCALPIFTGGAVQVRRESWGEQPLGVRVVTWLSYGIARLLTGLFAYGRAREFT